MRIQRKSFDEGGGIEVTVSRRLAFSLNLTIQWVSTLQWLKAKVLRRPSTWNWVELTIIHLEFEKPNYLPWYWFEASAALLGFYFVVTVWSPKKSEENDGRMPVRATTGKIPS